MGRQYAIAAYPEFAACQCCQWPEPERGLLTSATRAKEPGETEYQDPLGCGLVR